jgi:glycosyltransferase involved in cell wall biosynthesis
MTADAVGGVWRYSLDLIQGLVANGAEVLLATMGPRPSEDQRQQIAAIPNVTLAESEFALEWMPEPWADVDASAAWLLRLADDFRTDVIHLNGYSHAALPWRRPVAVVAHSCVFSWWRAVHGCAPGSDWEEYRSRVLAGLQAATTVIAPSAAMAHAVATEYGLAPEGIRVIHNFSADGTPLTVDKEPFFLAAGRVWDKAKNMAMLDSLSPRLRWDLRICGPDSKEGILPYSELLKRMSQASIFVHPSLYEPFGLSVLEAARRNCCLVLSDIPTLRELWQDAAVFVHPKNPDSWVTELNRLTDDPGKRQELAHRAQVHAARYNAKVAIEQYEQAYRS